MLFANENKVPEPNPEDLRKECEWCSGLGLQEDRELKRYINCTRCKGKGYHLLPLPANWRPRCIGCGVFLRRGPDGMWGNSCSDCYEDPWWG